MAQKIDRNPFTPFINGFSFDQAFDGSTWQLTKGEDFDQAPKTVAEKLRDEFTHRYGELQIKYGNDTLTIRHVAGTTR